MTTKHKRKQKITKEHDDEHEIICDVKSKTISDRVQLQGEVKGAKKRKMNDVSTSGSSHDSDVSQRVNLSHEEAMKKFISVVTNNVQREQVTSLEQLCCNPTDHLIIADISSSILAPEVVEDDLEAQRCVRAEDSDAILQALILPSDMMWPTFHDEKDHKTRMSASKHILFRRVALHSEKREKLTGQSITSDGSVVYVGIPGIGKTQALNYVLLRCLHSWVPKEVSTLGYANFPYRRVIFRLGSGFYVITNTTQEGDDRLSTDVKYVVSDKLRDVKKECINHGYTRKDTLLLLELQEEEHIVKSMPINLVGTISSRGADQAFKQLYKGNGQFYLMDPWSYPECLAMGRVLDKAAGRNAEESGSITRQVREQFKYTGGVLRRLLHPESPEILRAELEGGVSEFFNIHATITVYNVPSAWEYYVAPFVRNYDKYDLRIRRVNYEFDYLTNATRRIVFSKLTDERSMQFLSSRKLAYQNHQLCVLYGALLENQGAQYNLKKELRRKRYKCFVNSSNANINFSDENVVPVRKVFPPRVSKLVQFPSQLINIEEEQFDEYAVYESSKINGPVFDFLVIRDKIAYIIQVSAKLPNDHPISVCAMLKVINDIRTKLSDLSEIRFIYVTRKPSTSDIGLQYKVRKRSDKNAVIKGSIDDLLERSDDIREEDLAALLEVSRSTTPSINIYIATSPLFDYEW